MGNEIDKFHCRKSARLFHKHCGFAAIFGKGYMANKICIDNNSVKKILGISTEENCGLATYLRLQDKIRSGNFDEEFQKTWCRFYGVTSRNANWKIDFLLSLANVKKKKISRWKRYYENWMAERTQESFLNFRLQQKCLQDLTTQSRLLTDL